MLSGRINRRQFVGGVSGTLAIGLLAACGQAPEPAPTQAPAQPTSSGGSGGGTATATAPSATGTAAATGTATATAPSSGDVKRGGTLVIGQDFGPQSMDPAKSNAWASTNVMELVYTNLLRWSPSMEMEPDLATKYEATDDNTYTFTLREGVKFHNGDPFTAEDVKFTFERIKDPATASPYISFYAPVDSVEVVDPLTAKFNLSRPFAPLLRYLSTTPHGSIVPKGAADDLDTKPIGTAAFKWVQHDLNQQVVLEKFDDYYEEGLPYLDKVIFKLLGDDTSISSALRSETVQITWLKDPKVAQNVSQSTKGITSQAGVSSRYLPIRFKLTEEPWGDVRVRRAMSLALDRQAIVDTVLGGFGQVGTFLPPSQFAGYTGDGSDLPYYQRDIEQAKSLLKEAGKENLTVPEFQIVAANQLDVQCAQIMKQQWAEAGITVNINPMEVGAILKASADGAYNMNMIGGVWRPDPDAEVQQFSSKSASGKNAGMSDDELDQLIQDGTAETDDEKRKEIYRKIQQRVLDQAYVIIPYTYPLRWELLWDYVKGYDVMPSNARLSVRKTWLDK